MIDDYESHVEHAAQAIASADALLIGAGAGMGVDSGLPDFRGDKGFWKAYPPFRGRKFAEMSNPVWFHSNPEQAWGFFGHRYNLYSSTEPHKGFSILRRWAEAKPAGYFVFTSNVDGHFQRAGFSDQRIVECHGAIGFLQCRDNCTNEVWPADEMTIDVDHETIRARSSLPRCKNCDSVARPNILMFGDWDWIHDRTYGQQRRYVEWINNVKDRRLAIIEFGAGLGVPTVRHECESHRGTLIRVNPREPQVPSTGIPLATGALVAIQQIDARLAST